MRTLVLGSAGQIGSGYIEWVRLNDPGSEVIEFDIKNRPEEDLRMSDTALSDAIRASEVVLFLAFDVGGSKYLADYEGTFEFIDNNIRIMANTFRELKVHQKPFVFASSQMSTMNWSPYGVLKSIGEKYAHALGGVIVRFWNVYGIEADPEKYHVITDFVKMAFESGEIRMATEGSEKRQFLHVADCSRALHEILHVLEDDNRKENDFDISSFCWTSVLDIANMVRDSFAEMYDKEIRVIPGEASDDVQHGTLNEPREDIFSIWRPSIDIENGIRDMVQQYGKIWGYS